ncbi:MAG: hypothetical protein AAF957_25705 [Planctomycetota bacterium]
MSDPKLEITTGDRTIVTPLRPGLTRIGAPGSRGVHVEIEGAAGELHVWDEPPKVVRVRGDDALIVDGDMVEEGDLAGGTVFAWCGAKFRFEAPAAVLEEIVEEAPAPRPQVAVASRPAPVALPSSAPPPPAPPAPSGPTEAVHGDRVQLDGAELVAWRRMAAGMLVELNLAEKRATKRWQSAVMEREWDPDAAARDILTSSGDATSDPRFLERAGRLERDLLMASFQRGVKGASRRARGAARNTTAFLVANVIAIACYSAIILALLILARVKYDWSLDGIIDRMVDAVTPGLLAAPTSLLTALLDLLPALR